MGRTEIVNEINRVLSEYCSVNSSYDLESWLKQLFECLYADKKLGENFEATFRFKDTFIVFVESLQCLNLTQVVNETDVLEVTIHLSELIGRWYGLKKSLNELKEVIRLYGSDFDLLAIQVTQLIEEWNSDASLFSSAGHTWYAA